MFFENISEKPLKPAEFAEKQLLGAILDSTYKSGQALPGERVLATALGITRPTLRETLQRLSREGWLTIRHGKSTIVNDYLEKGGLGILSTLARFGKNLPDEMVLSLLQARSIMFPGIALLAAKNDSESILAYLKQLTVLKDEPKGFVAFDLGLQMLMVRKANNPVFLMIFNDFKVLFEIFGQRYFHSKSARDFSLSYYKDLAKALKREDGKIFDLVQKTMKQTEKIWQENNEDR